MRLSLSFVFLTFVLISCPTWSAGPTSTKPGFSKKSWSGTQDKRPDPTKTEPTNATQSPEYVDPYDQTPQLTPRPRQRGPIDLNVYGGGLTGDLLDVGEKVSTVFLGARYIPHKKFSRAWDYSAEVHSQNILNVNVGHRWYLDDVDFYKPYYRASVSNFINAGDGLAGLVNLRHMKIMGSFGCSDFLEMNRRFVAEAGAGYGMAGFAMYVQAGYNFNF
jgi:hypothetical protein